MVIEEQIKELAYSIWQQEGCPEGKDVEHYYRAKQTLEERENSPDSSNAPVSPASTSTQASSAPKSRGSKSPLKKR